MDFSPPRNLPASEPDLRSFPPRTHPGRPPERGERRPRGASPGDGRYPARCNPQRARPPLNESQRELAACYLPLATAIARQVGSTIPEASDEFRSTAYLALVESAGTFDPSRNVNFATYARVHIQGALIDLRNELGARETRDRRRMARCKARKGEVVGLGGRAVELACETPVGAELEALETFESWVRRLPGPHARALRHIYLDGLNQEETAVELGCSKSTMSRLHSQGLDWLQQNRELILDD